MKEGGMSQCGVQKMLINDSNKRRVKPVNHEERKGVCPNVTSENADKQEMNNLTNKIERWGVCPCMTTLKRDQRRKERAMLLSKASKPC